ncbi:MAG: helix-turn-helix transcriptional regulator [Candidatus Tectomicrobia bacterium]|nr:helix-turn-helix transcriptional regulator [Candidatus Tectomicrobia bacterium]
MDPQGKLSEVLAALHDATLDDALWPRASALIDDACGATGNALVVSERFGDDSRIHFRACYYRGERNEELMQDYFCNYHHRDERVARIRRLPDSRLVHTPDLYTEREKKTSPAYNEALLRTGDRNGLAVRLDGPDDKSISWIFADPCQPGDWESYHIEMIERLVPHLRRFVHIRQVVASARALGSSVGGLLDNAGIGIVHLDQQGRILEVNGRAVEILRRFNGLFDHKGSLHAWLPEEDARLQRLLAAALPQFHAEAAAGSMTIGRFPELPRLVLHIRPVHDKSLDFGAGRVAALVLVTDPQTAPALDVELVGEALGLTPAEAEVAVMLSQGRTTRDIATATTRKISTVYMLIRRAYRKLGISRQADLVRLVLSLVDLSVSRP